MTRTHTILLLGGGGHAAVVAESVRRSGHAVIGYVSDRAPNSRALSQTEAVGLTRCGDLTAIPQLLNAHGPCLLHAAVGDNTLRQSWMQQVAGDGRGDDHASWATIIDPTATVSPSAVIEGGAFVGPGAIINARATIGHGSIVNTAAVVEHDVRIDAWTHIGPRAVLTGDVSVGRLALIGAGAIVLPRRSVGDASIIGAGAVVVRDIPSSVTATGIPARWDQPTDSTTADVAAAHTTAAPHE